MAVTAIFLYLVQGVLDLFRLPYKQYQRDGRIVRGLQLGAQSFTSRTALAALELTTRIIYLLQVSFLYEQLFIIISIIIHNKMSIFNIMIIFVNTDNR